MSAGEIELTERRSSSGDAIDYGEALERRPSSGKFEADRRSFRMNCAHGYVHCLDTCFLHMQMRMPWHRVSEAHLWKFVVGHNYMGHAYICSDGLYSHGVCSILDVCQLRGPGHNSRHNVFTHLFGLCASILRLILIRRHNEIDLSKFGPHHPASPDELGGNAGATCSLSPLK